MSFTLRTASRALCCTTPPIPRASPVLPRVVLSKVSSVACISFHNAHSVRRMSLHNSSREHAWNVINAAFPPKEPKNIIVVEKVINQRDVIIILETNHRDPRTMNMKKALIDGAKQGDFALFSEGVTRELCDSSYSNYRNYLHPLESTPACLLSSSGSAFGCMAVSFKPQVMALRYDFVADLGVYPQLREIWDKIKYEILALYPVDVELIDLLIDKDVPTIKSYLPFLTTFNDDKVWANLFKSITKSHLKKYTYPLEVVKDTQALLDNPEDPSNQNQFLSEVMEKNRTVHMAKNLISGLSKVSKDLAAVATFGAGHGESFFKMLKKP